MLQVIRWRQPNTTYTPSIFRSKSTTSNSNAITTTTTSTTHLPNNISTPKFNTNSNSKKKHSKLIKAYCTKRTSTSSSSSSSSNGGNDNSNNNKKKKNNNSSSTPPKKKRKSFNTPSISRNSSIISRIRRHSICSCLKKSSPFNSQSISTTTPDMANNIIQPPLLSSSSSLLLSIQIGPLDQIDADPNIIVARERLQNAEALEQATKRTYVKACAAVDKARENLWRLERVAAARQRI